MAYTATLRRRHQIGASYALIIEFSDGTDTHEEQIQVPITASVDEVRSLVYKRIKELENVSVIESIPIGSSITAPTPPAPDAEKDTFISNVNLLKKIKKGVDLNIVSASDPRIATLETAITTVLASRPGLISLI